MLTISATSAFADPSELTTGETLAPSSDAVLSKAPLVPKSKNGQAAPNALPSGCIGYSQKPYKGGATSVFASGDTSCGTTVPEIHVSSTLARSRWYGWEPLDSDSETRFWAATATSDLGVDCFGEGTYDYRNDSYHEVQTTQVLWANTYDQRNGVTC